MSTMNENTTPETEVNQETATVVEPVKIVDAAAVENAIRKSVYTAMGVGIVPLPFFNVAAVTASNLYLVRKISDMYGIEFKEGAARKIITAVIGAGVGTAASPFVESLVGCVPLVGLPLVIGTKPALNAMTTYALGRMFVTHFDNGGTFVGANMDVMKENFKTAFKNSREWLGDTIKGKDAADATANA